MTPDSQTRTTLDLEMRKCCKTPEDENHFGLGLVRSIMVWMVKLEREEEGSAMRLDAAQPEVSAKSEADREQMLRSFYLMFRSSVLRGRWEVTDLSQWTQTGPTDSLWSFHLHALHKQHADIWLSSSERKTRSCCSSTRPWRRRLSSQVWSEVVLTTQTSAALISTQRTNVPVKPQEERSFVIQTITAWIFDHNIKGLCHKLGRWCKPAVGQTFQSSAEPTCSEFI